MHRQFQSGTNLLISERNKEEVEFPGTKNWVSIFIKSIKHKFCSVSIQLKLLSKHLQCLVLVQSSNKIYTVFVKHLLHVISERRKKKNILIKASCIKQTLIVSKKRHVHDDFTNLCIMKQQNCYTYMFTLVSESLLVS